MKPNIFLLILPLLSSQVWATEDKKQVVLTIQDSQTNLLNSTQIYFDNGLGTKYVALQDIQENFDSVDNRPLIYSYTSDGVACSSNGYGDFTQSVTIALGVKLNESSSFIISALQITNFDPISAILLEDRLQGTLTDLRQGNDTFQVNSPAEINNRFFLHLIYPPVLQTTAADCADSNGVVSITEDSSITWSKLLLFSANDTFLQGFNNITGNLSFTGLPGDSFIVAFIFGSNTTVKDVFVNSHHVSVNISVESPVIAVNQTVQFSSSAVNATNFDWAFGDGSLITGIANPEFAYFDTGTFTVTVSASNEFSCSATASKEVKVQAEDITSVNNVGTNKLSIIVQQKTITINAADYQSGDYTYQLYDLNGQLLMTNPVNESTVTVSMNGQPAGIYVMNIASPNGNFTKKIFVE